MLRIPSLAFVNRLFVAIFFLLTGVTCLADEILTQPARCWEEARCDADRFAMDVLWGIQFLLDKKWDSRPSSSIDSEAKLERAMDYGSAILIVSELVILVFDGKSKLTRQDYMKFVNQLKVAKAGEKIVNKLKKVVVEQNIAPPEQMMELVLTSLVLRRPESNLNEFRASPRSFDQVTMRFSAVARYVLGDLFIGSASGDLNPVKVSTSKLSKDDRAKLISKCGNIVMDCKIVIWVVTNKSELGVNVDATRLEPF